MQLFLEGLNDVLEFREIFRRSLDQGLVSFQHRLRPSDAVFLQRYWKSLPVLFYGAQAYVEQLVQPQATCQGAYSQTARLKPKSLNHPLRAE